MTSDPTWTSSLFSWLQIQESPLQPPQHSHPCHILHLRDVTVQESTPTKLGTKKNKSSSKRWITPLFAEMLKYMYVCMYINWPVGAPFVESVWDQRNTNYIPEKAGKKFRWRTERCRVFAFRFPSLDCNTELFTNLKTLLQSTKASWPPKCLTLVCPFFMFFSLQGTDHFVFCTHLTFWDLAWLAGVPDPKTCSVNFTTDFFWVNGEDERFRH